MAARPIRKLFEVMGLLDRGRFAEACDEGLEKALTTLASLPGEKGKATLTVTLDIAYDKGRIDVLPGFKAKLPDNLAFGRTPFWEYEGALSTQHPSQMDMFIRGAPEGERETG